jgi:hypothetical protein
MTIFNAVSQYLVKYWRDHPETANAILNRIYQSALSWQRTRPAGGPEIRLPQSNPDGSPKELHHYLDLPSGYTLRMYRSNGQRMLIAGQWWKLFPWRHTEENVVRETLRARRLPDFPTDGMAIGCNQLGELLILLPERMTDQRWCFRKEAYSWHTDTGVLRKIADDLAECEPQLPCDPPVR